MDWLLLLVLISLLIVGAIAAFYLHAFVTRTREEFRAAQPDLRVTNMSAMSSGNVLTIYPELQNVGGGVRTIVFCTWVAGKGISPSKKSILEVHVVRSTWHPSY